MEGPVGKAPTGKEMFVGNIWYPTAVGIPMKILGSIEVGPWVVEAVIELLLFDILVKDCLMVLLLRLLLRL